ncbi:MAG: substrate-binding periplasmic protein [Desulfovibrio sp.]
MLVNTAAIQLFMKHVLLSIMICLGCCEAAFGETVVMGVSDWPPYVFAGSSDHGMATEIAAAAFAEEGYDLILEFRPWARIEYEVKNGLILGSVPWLRSEYREEFAYYSDRMFSSKQCVFYLKKDFPEGLILNRVEGLRPYIVGVQNGNLSMRTLKKKGIFTDVSNDVETAFGKMFAGRFSLLIESIAVGIHTLQERYGQKLHEVGLVLLHKEAADDYAIFSKKFPNSNHYHDAFNRGLKAIKENGVYDTIIQKYQTVQGFHSEVY